MSRTPIYHVEHEGKMMTLYEYAAATGMAVTTLRKRALDGRPIKQPSDMEKGAKRLAELDAAVSRFRDGYTLEELEALYKNFKGQENELEMLQDFTGLGFAAAQRLLYRLKENRKE